MRSSKTLFLVFGMILLLPATWATAQAIKPRVTVDSGKEALKEFLDLEKGLVSKERKAVEQIAERQKSST